MTSAQAQSQLAFADVGTFLVRDSQRDGFLFSLSLMTNMGITSVRISYANRFFWLDCERKLRETTPKYGCVVKLLEHHVIFHKEKKPNHVWRDGTGQKDAPVVLTHPLRKTIPSLQHLCRMSTVVAVRKNTAQSRLDEIKKLPLPGRLKYFLSEYPYQL